MLCISAFAAAKVSLLYEKKELFAVYLRFFMFFLGNRAKVEAENELYS